MTTKQTNKPLHYTHGDWYFYFSEKDFSIEICDDEEDYCCGYFNIEEAKEFHEWLGDAIKKVEGDSGQGKGFLNIVANN